MNVCKTVRNIFIHDEDEEVFKDLSESRKWQVAHIVINVETGNIEKNRFKAAVKV